SENARQPQNAENNDVVPTGARVVVIAVQQDLIDKIANLVPGSLKQSEPQVPGRELHAVVVLRDLSWRRQNHDRGRGCKLPCPGVVVILKPGSPGQCVD